MTRYDHTQVLAAWRRIRRYAVPRWMIEQATERRLAGDWEGACRAANVKVEVDLRSVSRLPGSRTRRAVEGDLRHFAPDLLRWHLPRLGGRTTVAPNRAIVLAKYGRRLLHVLTPSFHEGPQHLTLRLGKADTAFSRLVEVDWTLLRHLWDVRHSGELLERSGGGGGRAPFFHPDGTPLAEEELGDPGTGPAGLTEHVTLLLDRGEHEAALDAAGIDLDPTMPETSPWYEVTASEILAALAPTRLVPELERIGGDSWLIRYDWNIAMALERQRRRTRLRLVDIRSKVVTTHLPEPHWQLLPDLDLLRTGRITPDELHPLVRSALFPARPPAEGPVGPPNPEPPGPVRVRCHGEWHIVRSRDGRLHIPHNAQERDRESAMGALGGRLGGCFAVQHAWETGHGRLPRRLRAQRQEMFMRAQHGDTPGVLRVLNQGANPASRDGRGRTLLHYLHMLDHTQLLPRLLDAGLNLEARDALGRTPLLTVVAEHGMDDVIRALLDAGAKTNAADYVGWGVYDLIHRNNRTDLAWLKTYMEEKHPGIKSEPPDFLP